MAKPPNSTTSSETTGASQSSKFVTQIKKGVFAGGVVFILWVILVVILGSCIGMDKVGQFGDSMAFMGLLLTAAGLMYAAYATHLQRIEMEATREELTKANLVAEQRMIHDSVRQMLDTLGGARAYVQEFMANIPMDGVNDVAERIIAVGMGKDYVSWILGLERMGVVLLSAAPTTREEFDTYHDALSKMRQVMFELTHCTKYGHFFRGDQSPPVGEADFREEDQAIQRLMSELQALVRSLPALGSQKSLLDQATRSRPQDTLDALGDPGNIKAPPDESADSPAPPS